MTEILRPCEKWEYPTEYLLARLRGRKANLLKNWSDLMMHPDPAELLMNTQYGESISAHSAEGIWECALMEFNWVYNQMNHYLAELFKPFFVYLELRTLMICLRHRAGSIRKPLSGDILYYSLLSDKVKETLAEEPDIPSIMARLEKTICLFGLKNGQLSEIFRKEGLKGLEAHVTAAVFQYISFSELHPVIKRFFMYLADSRNVIAVYKHFRWDISEKPVLVEGGGIRKPVLENVLRDGSMQGILSLAGKLAGTSLAEMPPPNIENIFLAHMTKQVQAMGRLSDAGFILQYLWSRYIEAHNLGIILYGRGIERDVLKEELVI
jgi:hypothetical protein